MTAEEIEQGIKQARAKVNIDYVPVDFDSYSILDRGVVDSEKELRKDERIWRISSLTAQVDDDTRILVLPLPESKRPVKIADTAYKSRTYLDLFSRTKQMEEQLQLQSKSEPVRFEDKTEEEVAKEKRIRSRQRIEKMMRIRTY